MLSEFAFTPAIFDENAHEDKEAWREQLRELAFALFPRTSVWPVMISDLYAGSWSSHIVSYIENMGDHRAKKICQSLLTNMQRMLVVRPECSDWPSDDDALWCREAIASHAVEPIDRIISVRSTKESSCDEFSMVRCIEEVLDGGFWRGINADASPRMVIAEQIQLLRKLCLHSQWVALINPYGFVTEQDFTIELIKLAMQRDARFGAITFELHGNELDIVDPNERAIRQQTVTDNMTRSIKPFVAAGSTVQLYFWPKLLDRIIVAGKYVRQSDGTIRKSPRWGASMNHIARTTVANAAPTEWKLLRPDSLGSWFREYVIENTTNKPTPITIQN